MKVCILGGGLIGLTLAKTLVNEGISVDIFLNQKIKSYNKSRTIGISKTNIDFFNQNILNINKFLWKIDKIEIFTKNLKNENLLSFEDSNDQLFSTLKNHKLYDYLIKELQKNNLLKFINFFDIKKFYKHNYKLIINCEQNNAITKKYFSNKISKSYDSQAYTTIIEHKKYLNNHKATQIFTERGPLAFLPISEYETSIVYSVKGSQKINLENSIRKYNSKYSITKINKISNFKLKSINLRSYYYQNILAFGDLLHRLHPLAGQGFNMSIRDIKELINLIKTRIDLGLDLDSSICKNFEKKTRHKNYLFSNGIDFVYEFFNFEGNLNNLFLTKSVQALGKNKYANTLFKKYADIGLTI